MREFPVVDVNRCSRCNTCINSCPEKAVYAVTNSCCAKCIKYCIAFPVPCSPDYLCFDYDKCTSCGLCVELCSQGALSMSSMPRVISPAMECIEVHESL